MLISVYNVFKKYLQNCMTFFQGKTDLTFSLDISDENRTHQKNTSIVLKRLSTNDGSICAYIQKQFSSDLLSACKKTSLLNDSTASASVKNVLYSRMSEVYLLVVFLQNSTLLTYNCFMSSFTQLAHLLKCCGE